jgi:hypothetical protein
LNTLIPEAPQTELQTVGWAQVLTRTLKEFVGIVDRVINSLSPVAIGHAMPSVGLTIPTGWVQADGSLLDKASYPVLYGTIGDTYATGGESSTQFRLPNLTPVITGVPWILKAL